MSFLGEGGGSWSPDSPLGRQSLSHSFNGCAQCHLPVKKIERNKGRDLSDPASYTSRGRKIDSGIPSTF